MHRTGKLVVLFIVWAQIVPGGDVFAKPVLIYPPDEVRRVLSRRLSVDELSRLKIPYEADERISRIAVEVTRHAHDDHQKLRSLMAYFRKQGYLDRYHKSGTRTAREVMRFGAGNCLSYANLFVAMARSVGLRAFYLDASRVINEFGRSGRVLVDYGHMLVGVRIGAELRAIDFDHEAKAVHRYNAISDLQAIADYYNNLGFERSWSGAAHSGFSSPDVIQAFDLATRIWPGYARAWNNLGVALSKSGRMEQAALCYRRAIQADGEMAAPHVNLSQILGLQGKDAEATREMRRAVQLSPENPHYRYFLGRQLARGGDHSGAQEQLEKGAALDDDFFLIHMELARIHKARGDLDRAARSARRVLQIVPNHLDAKRLLEDLPPARD